MRALRVGFIAAGLLTAAPLSMAAQVTSSFTASATVMRGCAIAVNDLAFGNYAATAAQPTVLGTTTIRVTCQLGDTYTIGLDAGVNRAGAQRRMARVLLPVAYLNYNLFLDAARVQAWEDSAPTRVSGVGSGAPQSYTVYGQLPGAQIVPVGAYIDTVTVTVRN